MPIEKEILTGLVKDRKIYASNLDWKDSLR
jgi:hypothetical protein